MKKRIERYLSELKSGGKRESAARTVLLWVLEANSTPLSVPQILAALARRGKTVNKTTVYRELNTLLERGMVRELQFGDLKKRYELTPENHHHHLVCTRCHRVEDVELPRDLDFQERQIEKQKKFKILNHTLEFFGICAVCRRTRPPGA